MYIFYLFLLYIFFSASFFFQAKFIRIRLGDVLIHDEVVGSVVGISFRVYNLKLTLFFCVVVYFVLER